MTRASTDSTLFPPAEQIIGMATDAERAALILRLPDAIIHDRLGELCEASVEAGFTLGSAYLTVRAVSFSAVRRLDGSIPADIQAQVDDLRHAMMVVAFACAIQPQPASSPTGRTSRASRSVRPAASFSGGGMTDRSMKKIGKIADRIEDRAEPIGDFEFPIEMTEVGPQFVIPGCERPANADATDGGKA
ncbi:MAG: hypothetical protein M0R28_24345 [Pigmentiphaga sp.]|nr:hypothetical protein [Pigmentiphaga sp.]